MENMQCVSALLVHGWKEASGVTCPFTLTTQAGSRILAYDEKMGSSSTSEEWQTSGAVSDLWTCIRETLPEHPRLEPEGLWLFRKG